MSTKENETNELANLRENNSRSDNYEKAGMLDEYITTLCLDRTMGDVVYAREHSLNARSFFGSSLICDAVFNKDVNIVDKIVNRIDGSVPEKEDRYKYANLMGDALEDVLDYRVGENITIVQASDPCIIALAKVVVQVACEDAGNNFQKKKDKQLAIDMILQRTSGKRLAPVKDVLRLQYVEPDWMRPLPEGSNEEHTI